MKIAWTTDIHLNFASPRVVEGLCIALNDSQSDAVLIGGYHHGLILSLHLIGGYQRKSATTSVEFPASNSDLHRRCLATRVEVEAVLRYLQQQHAPRLTGVSRSSRHAGPEVC